MFGFQCSEFSRFEVKLLKINILPNIEHRKTNINLPNARPL